MSSTGGWGSWLGESLGYGFWCKMAAICINLGFLWKTTFGVFKRLSGKANVSQSEMENSINILIDVLLITCLTIDFLSLTSTSPVFRGLKWRPGWIQLLGITNVVASQLIESLSNSEESVMNCISRLSKSIEMELIIKELCETSDMTQYLITVVSGLRDYFFCAFYIATSYFCQKAAYQSLSRQQLPMSSGRSRFINV